MEVSASSPGKNEELTLALKTWSRLEEETTGRLRSTTGINGVGLGNGKERGEGVGIAERQREGLGLGLGPAAKRVGGTAGPTAVEVDNEDDDNDGTSQLLCYRPPIAHSGSMFLSLDLVFLIVITLPL